MPVSRMRMRPWLEQMINSNSISGLTWVDKEKRMFSIPWKHAARHGWELDKDASLFKMWAIHTGKYTEGQTSDPKTWKANFRCAMNSLPDIEEVKDKSIHKGQGAVRVFRMLQVSPKLNKRSKAKGRKLRKAIKTEEDTDYSDTQSPLNVSMEEDSTQENTVDSTVQMKQQDSELELFSPDWALSLDIETDFTKNICERFQVSPNCSPAHDNGDDIIAICRQLENESYLISGSLDFSRASLCSDSSSADESDNSLSYTTLSSDAPTDLLWHGLLQARLY